MNKQAELNIEKKLATQEVSITPYSESVLAELGIEQATLKLITPKWQRTQYSYAL